MSPFLVLPEIEKKLKEKHQVEPEEVREAFYNCNSHWLIEQRPEHHRSYTKEWTISETDSGRLLKIVLAKVG